MRAAEEAGELPMGLRRVRWRESGDEAAASVGAVAGVPAVPPTRRKRGGATRLCRHEPLLSTRSNRWDAAVTAKAFRSRRTCTPLPRRRIPGVLTLGSRGNPTHVEHRRQRHNKIDSESASVTRIRSPKFIPADWQFARGRTVPDIWVRYAGFNAYNGNCCPRLNADSTRSRICLTRSLTSLSMASLRLRLSNS